MKLVRSNCTNGWAVRSDRNKEICFIGDEVLEKQGLEIRQIITCKNERHRDIDKPLATPPDLKEARTFELQGCELGSNPITVTLSGRNNRIQFAFSCGTNTGNMIFNKKEAYHLAHRLLDYTKPDSQDNPLKDRVISGEAFQALFGGDKNPSTFIDLRDVTLDPGAYAEALNRFPNLPNLQEESAPVPEFGLLHNNLPNAQELNWPIQLQRERHKAAVAPAADPKPAGEVHIEPNQNSDGTITGMDGKKRFL